MTEPMIIQRKKVCVKSQNFETFLEPSDVFELYTQDMDSVAKELYPYSQNA